MLSASHPVSEKITESDLNTIIQELTNNLSILEVKVLKNPAKGKMKILSGQYAEEIQLLGKNLRMISTYYFQNVSGNKQRLYQHVEDNSDCYKAYLNAEENIAALVLHNIVSQKKMEQVIVTAERWVSIVK